jgi:DNA polymerase-1
MFAGYKASRSSHHTTFEIQHLKTLLPKLGVNQTYNPEEEADDVIATLVHRKLKGQLNSFLTTDRDLLQLVSDTNTQIVPAVGASKERLYTVEEVVEEYGVGPELLVHVRALSGDTSDEIPGVEGFGLKTATKLIKLYGSVDRLFTSNLAGLSSKQSKSLRASEQQVRLNLELLKLQDDLALTHVGPDPDQIAATERLREVDIKPDSILVAFFHNASGLTAHT